MLAAVRIRARRNDLDRESWLGFLEALIDDRKGSAEAVRINGQRLSQAQTRALHRWRSERASPSIFSADRFLTGLGLHLSDYFIHCQIHGLPPWALGIPPSWHDQDWWWHESE